MSMSSEAVEPRLEYMFQADVRVDQPLELGEFSGVRKRVIPIIGGEISGPRLAGQILSGGADWQAIREDNVTEVLARYTVRAIDGTLISVTNRGVRRGPAEVIRRLLAGEAIDPALYYFRSTPVFGGPWSASLARG